MNVSTFKKTGVRGASAPSKVLTPVQQRKIGLALSADQYMDRAYAIREVYGESRDIMDVAEYMVRNCLKQKFVGKFEMSHGDAVFLIKKYVLKMLESELYQQAAIILWGPELFTPEPHVTQLVWSALENHSKNIVIGGGSLSKSYSGAVRFGLEFIRDPLYTCIKVMSVTRQHAITNVYAHLHSLLQSTMVEYREFEFKKESIKASADEKQGIHLVSIPQGDIGKGRLRGFHPVPRPIAHPTFGRLSRVMLLLDEAEEIPEGVWEDVNNVLLTEEVDQSHVRIFAATNPKDRTSKLGQLCEPKNGWASVDMDVHETWEAASGWNVVRLDGARCENVEQRKIVYPGFQTYEGFERLLKLGTDNPEYYTMARGWFPEQSAQVVIVGTKLFSRSKGFYTWSGPTITAAGVDPAFEGGDLMPMTILRVGNAVGWTDAHGEYHKFLTERRVIQIEQQIMMEKAETMDQSRKTIKLCKEMSIKPRWLTVDRTGNGTGYHDCLKGMFGPSVFGVMFSWAPTDTRILDDDTDTPEELYADIVTEMAWAVRKYMETDLLKLNPGINWNALEKQTTTRRYSQVGRGIVKIESKKDFKKRSNGESPDRFDSLLVAVHGVRMNAGMSGSFVENPVKPERAPRDQPTVGIVDSLDFMDVVD